MSHVVIPCYNRITTKEIFPSCDGLKMIGIEARAISTKVIYIKAARNGALVKHKRGYVRCNLPTLQINCSVSFRGSSLEPNPASILVLAEIGDEFGL